MKGRYSVWLLVLLTIFFWQCLAHWPSSGQMKKCQQHNTLKWYVLRIPNLTKEWTIVLMSLSALWLQINTTKVIFFFTTLIKCLLCGLPVLLFLHPDFSLGLQGSWSLCCVQAPPLLVAWARDSLRTFFTHLNHLSYPSKRLTWSMSWTSTFTMLLHHHHHHRHYHDLIYHHLLSNNYWSSEWVCLMS